MRDARHSSYPPIRLDSLLTVWDVRRRMRLVRALVLSAVAVATPALAGPPASFTTTVVASGFELPTAFAQAPDGRLFVTEKRGVVKVVDGGAVHTFLDIADQTNEYVDRGLLGIALDPAFAASGWVYLYHIEESDPGNPDAPSPAIGTVFRIRASALDPNVADPATRTVVLTGFDNHHYSHSGGCLRFDAQGRLLMSFGDGSSYESVDPLAVHTYDLSSLNGKIVRVDPMTGAGVPDNPYFDAANPTAVRSKVLARGFRNPFRFGIEPGSGDLWVGDVGWGFWEEVDRVPLVWTNRDLDLNFGWPCYEGVAGVSAQQGGYASDASTAAVCATIYTPAEGGTGIGATPAVFTYNHGDPGGENGSAVTGGVFYQGGAYPSRWVGRYFFADYARDRFQTLDIAGAVEDFGEPGEWGNPVDIQLGPNGNVRYLAIGTGELREIVYAGGNRPPTVVATGLPLDGPAPLRVKFDGRSSTDPDGDRLRYAWDFGDGSRIRKSRRPGHRYKLPGTYVVHVTVMDRRKAGLTDATTLVVNVGNTAPIIAFTQPANGATYAVGDVLPIVIAATDAEDGSLGGAAVTWQVLLHHLGHLHYLPLVHGASGSFQVPDHGDDSHLSIVATATDSLGAKVTTEVTLVPRTVTVSVLGSPSGAQALVDGQPRTTPWVWQSIVGGSHSVTAPSPQTLGGTSYGFASWSDGLAQTHGFVTPAVPKSLTATYAPN